MNNIRSLLYTLARLLGDINAVRQGPVAIGMRIIRRIIGKLLGRLMP